MIVFRDRAFCSAFGVSCGNGDCSDAFTPSERRAAIAWWGEGNPPVQFADLSPGCPFRLAIGDGLASPHDSEVSPMMARSQPIRTR
jgi:hypothetical protein